MKMDNLRDRGIEYLVESGFVDALVKKTIFNCDIDEYYEDYRQETWLAILELKDEIWPKLYNSAKEKGVDYEYEIRNYISRIILNTCRSRSSNAYRKLKKHKIREKEQDEVMWGVLRNSIPEKKTIEEQIIDYTMRVD